MHWVEDHRDPSRRRQTNRTLRGGSETAHTVNQLPCHPLWEEEEKELSDDEEENREEEKGSEEKPKTRGQVRMMLQ